MFVVASRQVLIDSKFSTVICAPVYSARHGLSTQVPVGAEDKLKHESAIHCDELVSLPKSAANRFPWNAFIPQTAPTRRGPHRSVGDRAGELVRMKPTRSGPRT